MYNKDQTRGKILKNLKTNHFFYIWLSIIDLSEDANQPFEDDDGILILMEKFITIWN